MHYKEIKLGEALKKIVGGGTPSTKNKLYWDGKIPWASVKDMPNENYSLSSTEDYITEKGLQNSSTNLIEANTVIISTRMGLGRAFVNEVDMAINQDLKALFPKNILDKKYLFWFMLSQAKSLQLLGSGTTVSGLRLNIIKDLKIKLYPINIQKKIAAIISNYDDLINNNLKRINILHKIGQKLYEEMFVCIKKDLHQKNWKKIPIKNLTYIKSGFAFKSSTYANNGKLGVVTIKNIHNKKFITKIKNYIVDIPRNMPKHCVIKFGDILISLTGEIGRICFAHKGNYLMNQRVAKLIPKKDIDKPFIYFLLNQKSIQNEIYSISTGTAQQNVSPIKIGNINLRINENLKNEFSIICNPIIKKINILNLQTDELKKLRKLFIDTLFSEKFDFSIFDKIYKNIL